MMASIPPIEYHDPVGDDFDDTLEVCHPLDREDFYVPPPPPPFDCGRPRIVAVIVCASIEKNKRGRISFVAKIGDPNFMADEIRLEEESSLDTWYVTSVRFDGTTEMTEGTIPAHIFTDRGYSPRFGSVRTKREIRIDLRRIWAPKPQLVITRRAGRWHSIHGRVSRPAPRARPKYCAVLGYSCRQR